MKNRYKNKVLSIQFSTLYFSGKNENMLRSVVDKFLVHISFILYFPTNQEYSIEILKNGDLGFRVYP